MKVLKLYAANCYPNRMVVKTLDGTFHSFFITPAREIGSRDLLPMPYYIPRGNNAEEAEDYVYQMYGLQRAV